MNEETPPPSEHGKYPNYPYYPMYPSSASPSHTRRRRFLEFLRSYWWIPLLTVTAAVCGMAFYLRSQPPAFASYATLFVSGKINLPQGGAFTEELQFFYGNQIKLLQSELLHMRALNRLRAVRPELPLSRIKLQVVQEARSAMFTLRAFGAEPTFPQAYLNALIDAFLEYKKEVRGNATDVTTESISSQVFEREKELRAEQSKVNAYQTNHSIPNLQVQSESWSRDLANLNGELGRLRLELQLMDGMSGNEPATNGAGTSVTSPETTPNLLPTPASSSSGLSPEVLAAQRKIRELKAERDGLKDLKPMHPKIQKIDEQIAKVYEIIESMRQQTRDELGTRKKSLELKMQGLLQSKLETEKKLQEVSAQLTEYERLKANVNLARGMYDQMSQMLRTVDVSKNLDQETMQVMSPASEAAPALPDFQRQLGIAALLGLLVGLGIILLVERLDDRFTALNELVELFDEEIIGQVPETVRNRSTRRIDLVKPEDSRHIFAESYRNIRSSLLFMAVEGERPKILLVTSGIPNEGKSTVAANLARTIAFAGSKVLLIDADMRRGGQHNLYGLARDPGLSEYLRKPGKLDDVIRVTELENLFLIPSGKPIENAGEHFLSSYFDAMLREARERFDYVIIDSPPVFAADDATTLAPKIDGVLFILRGSFTRARLARQALDLLYQRQAKVLGLIFNRANTTSRSYYYYKYSDYYHRKGRKR